MIYFRLVPFLKAIMGSMLNVFLQLRFACNMCQCFIRISFKFGNARIYVTDNGMHCLSRHFCWWSSGTVVFHRVGQLSEFAIWQHLFCILCQQIVQQVFYSDCGSLGMLSIFVKFEVLGCRKYFSLMSTDVPISH